VKCGLCGGKCCLKKKNAACLRVKALTLQLDAVPGLKDYVNGNGKVSFALGYLGFGFEGICRRSLMLVWGLGFRV
jgi:hypothetical protein